MRIYPMACASKKSFRWVTTLGGLAKRTSEKWPNGGIGGARSAACHAPFASAHTAPRKLQPPTQLMRQWRGTIVREGAAASVRPDTGDQHDFAARTRAKFIERRLAFGTVVITYWAR